MEDYKNAQHYQLAISIILPHKNASAYDKVTQVFIKSLKHKQNTSLIKCVVYVFLLD